MKIKSVELTGFRAFAKSQRFDLDADAVVVVAANGHGKTSLFDGVLWALCGRVPRLGDGTSFVSLFSETGQASVQLTLQPSNRAPVVITRSVSAGAAPRLSVEIENNTYSGPTAEGRLIDMVCPTALAAADPNGAVASVVTNSLYLQQDLIRDFVEATSVEDRFAAVSELIGAGRVNELQSALERAKKAWTAATNVREQEMRAQRERLTIVEAHFAELSKTASQQKGQELTSELWKGWWTEVAKHGVSHAYPEHGSRDASTAIDAALKELEANRRAAERRLESLRAVQADAKQLLQMSLPPLEAIRARLAAAAKSVEEGKTAVQKEQGRLAEERRVQAQLQETRQQLQTLAVLALKHLNENCPVCTQKYDKDATRKRLQEMARDGGAALQAPRVEVLDRLLLALSGAEREHNAVQLELRAAEQALQRRNAFQQSISERLKLLDLRLDVGPDLVKELDAICAAASGTLEQIARLRRSGESFALALVATAAVSTIGQLAKEREALRKDQAEKIRQIASRNTSGERAQGVIEALRQASLAIVDRRLNQINPVLQGIYARIDPHPAFRLVHFLSSIDRGKGQLATVVSDPITEKQSDIPAAVLSSSQVNALAVSVFLALNIGIPNPLLPLAMLDDPMQSMDDIHLLGLVDLLRRLKPKRQLLVSTHDARFGELLARKLRPTTDGEKTRVVELQGWTRKGPSVIERDIRRDMAPLKLVANR